MKNILKKKLLSTIKNFDLDKVHDRDMISIRMIKSCDTSICKPLKFIFRSYLKNGIFPPNGKNLMWFQHTKKEKNKT